MAAERKRKVDPIPEDFETLEAAAEFWDTHDLTDYLDQSRPVKDLVFQIERRHFVVQLDSDLVEPLSAKARRNGTTSQALVNRWIRERLRSKPRQIRKQKEAHR